MRSWVCSHSRSLLSLLKSVWLWKMIEMRSGLTGVVPTLMCGRGTEKRVGFYGG